MENNEQWKYGGDCSLCRRERYCSNPCTLVKRQQKAILRRLVGDAMNRMTGGAMKEVIDKTYSGYKV